MTQTGKRLVVYVDDDKDDIELMVEAFENYPHLDFHTFTEIDLFLRYITNEKLSPSLILIDINMPLINGKELLCSLRKFDHLKKVMVVLYTTSSSKDDKVFANSLQAHLITKPYTKLQLDRTLEELLHQCSLI